jgi:uncharacterized membrane protein YfhO
MIDFSIGLGFDTLTSLNYYVLGDPLTVLSVFAKPESMEFVYSLFVLLRFFLAGLAFTLFCFYKKQPTFPTILGSLIYAFSSYALFAGLRHPFFLNPLIYLPLILIGINRLIIKKKGLFFSLMIAISAISNFYFLYMLTIIVIIYALVIYVDCQHKDDNGTAIISFTKRASNFMGVFVRSSGYYLLGIGLSGIILFPTIYAFLHNGRIATGGNATSLLHYDFSYYKSLLKTLFTFGQGASNWTFTGVSVLAALCIVIALFYKKKLSMHKIFFLLCVIFLMIPFFGKMMNGFSAISNRWCFLLTFLLSYFVVAHYDNLFTTNRRIKHIMLGCVIIYCIYAIFLGNIYVRIPTLLLSLMFTWIRLCIQYPQLEKLKHGIMLLLVCLNLIISSNLFLAPFGLNFSEESLAYGEIKQITSSPAKDYLPELDGGFYRIQDNLVSTPNLGLTSHQYGNSFYLSLMSDHVYQSMLELSNASLRFASQFLGFDNRSFLMSLNGVKYYITADPNEVPYGFHLSKHITEGNQDFYIYENDFALPLGYTYDSYLTNDNYQKLSPLEMQEALMQCIILEEPSKIIEQGRPQYSITKVPTTISYSNITMDNHLFTVLEPRGKFTLSYKAPKNSELYLSIDNLSLTPSNHSKIYLRTITDKTHHNFTTYRASTDIYYFGAHGRLLNLGYHETASKKTQLEIDQRGTYTLGSLNIYAVSMDNFKNYYKHLTKNTLTSITMTTNKITGEIKSDKNQMLLLTIPYSPGWSATLDGEAVTIYRANTMYSAIDLTPGTHNLILTYQTPYISLGITTSLISLLLTILIYAKKRAIIVPS